MRSDASHVLGDCVVHDCVGPLGYTYVRLRLGQADAHRDLTRSDPHAIYYSFAENPEAFLMRDNGCTERIDVAANTSGGTGSEPLRWVGAPSVLEFVEFGVPGHARLTVAEDADRPDLADLATLSGLKDPAAEVAGRRLRAAALGGEPLNELEAEAIMLSVLRQRITFLGGRVRRRTDHGLDARRLKRVVDYIDVHLTDDLRTETLADVAAVWPAAGFVDTEIGCL